MTMREDNDTASSSLFSSTSAVVTQLNPSICVVQAQLGARPVNIDSAVSDLETLVDGSSQPNLGSAFYYCSVLLVQNVREMSLIFNHKVSRYNIPTCPTGKTVEMLAKDVVPLVTSRAAVVIGHRDPFARFACSSVGNGGYGVIGGPGLWWKRGV